MQIHCGSTNNLPEELQCKKCMYLLCDAVVLPCCGNSTCERCVKACWSSNGMCSWCETPGCSVAQVIPNMQLRQAVENYISESGYRPERCVEFGDVVVSTSVSNPETSGSLRGLAYEPQATVQGRPSPTVLPLESSLPIPRAEFDCEITRASVNGSCVTSMDSKLTEALTVDALPGITDPNSSSPITMAVVESTTTIESAVDTSATCSVSNSNEFSENCKENTLPTDSVPSFDPQFYYNQTAMVNYQPMYLYPQASFGYGQSMYPFGFPMPPVPPPFFPQRWLNEHEFYKLQLHMRESHDKCQGYYGRSHRPSLAKTNSRHSSRHNQPKRSHHKDYSTSPSAKKSCYDSDADVRQSRSSSNRAYAVSYLKNNSHRDIRKYPDKTSSKYYQKHGSMRPGEFYSSHYQNHSRKDYYKHSSGSKSDRYRRHCKSSTRKSHYRSRSKSFSKERSREYVRKRRDSASAQSNDDKSPENDYKESRVSKKEKSYSSEHSSRSYGSQCSVRDDERRGSSVSKFRRSSRSKSSIRRKDRKGRKKHKKAKSSARRGNRPESESRNDRRQVKRSCGSSSSDCCTDDQSKSHSSAKDGRLELCLGSSKSNGYTDQSVVDASDGIENTRKISKHSRKRSSCRVTESRSRSRDSVVASDCNNGNKKTLEASAERRDTRHSGSPFSASGISDRNPRKETSKLASEFLGHEEKSACKAADNRDVQNKNGFPKCCSQSKTSHHLQMKETE